MVATQQTKEPAVTSVAPEIAVPSAERAISIVNRWLHTDVGTAVNVSQAEFDASNFCWHLPVQLAYPDTGPVGVIGDVCLDAATGRLLGHPEAEELKTRACALAVAAGLAEENEEESCQRLSLK